MSKRNRVEIAAIDERAIVYGLEQWAASDNFVALPTRAFVYLLWDGTVRTTQALSLNVSDVAELPAGKAGPFVAASATAPPCKGNRFRNRTFPMSRRCRGAIADYLDSASASFGADASTPLFLSHRNKRLSRESTISWWKMFIKRARCAREYQLENVVLTGRMAFLRERAATDPARALAGHAGISLAHAGRYVIPATQALGAGA